MSYAHLLACLMYIYILYERWQTENLLLPNILMKNIKCEQRAFHGDIADRVFSIENLQ